DVPRTELLRDPRIRLRETLFERDLRLPSEHFTQAGVVAVPAPHALRLGEVVALVNGLACDGRDDVHQLVDRHHTVLSQVQRLAVIRPHQAVDALDAIVDVAVGARLIAVAPDFNRALVPGQRLPAAH